MSTEDYTISSSDINTIDNALITEQSRLDLKKEQVDRAQFNQDRLIAFNESFRKRYAFYNTIVIYIIIILLIYLGIVLLKTYVPIIPPVILDIITIIIFAGAIIYVGKQINELYGRDNMDFDKIDPNSNSVLSQQEIDKIVISSAKSGDLSGYMAATNVNRCVGPACCADGTTWCEVSNRCILANTTCDGFESFVNQPDISVNGYISPYTPNEFENYSKI
jgi:uncharacterized membrane protein (DUF485 family)